jgi:hypothetical protein
MSAMKEASFTVRASGAQSVRWKIAAEAEGFRSVGAWLAGAADAYLKARARAGMPLPLAWRYGRFRVRLEDGAEPEVRGLLSPPFGIFHGTPGGPIPHGSTHRYCLVYVPARRIVATFKHASHCKALASELARLWVRWGGSEPVEDPAPIIDRHRREDL